MTDPWVLRQAILDRGIELGFSKIGLAPARLKDATPRLREWLERGYAGEMAYMGRSPDRRTDAGSSLRRAETVVCCALNYYLGGARPAPANRGVISAYARGEDYHRVLGEKLEALAHFIERRAEVTTRRYVDTGPLLEKAYAVAAGLGWLGKHSNLLSRDGSSWFFLGEILVPLELPLDTPTRDHCGTCSRCIDACPTRAIVQPYVVDSRLCISYLTIELRGYIPRELRPLMGTRIYGCDDCQDVCPWNRFAKISEEARFFPREPLSTMDLVSMLRLSREEFQQATRGSAMRRARYAGFLRNVAVALGNSGATEAVPALVQALSHEEPLVRGHAAWALGALGLGEASSGLLDALGREVEAPVREEIQWALAALAG